MKNIRFFIILTVYVAGFLMLSCGKTFLDMKPNQRERIPRDLGDYQALMNDIATVNQLSTHALGIFGGDEFYITDARYAVFPLGVEYNYQKNAYTWSNSIYEGGESLLIDWNIGYFRINWCNVVLDGLMKLNRQAADADIYDSVKGMALFHRALNYYNLAQLYCELYDEGLAEDILGLSIRLDPDPTQSLPRANLAETYRQILKDLMESLELLPDRTTNQFHANKGAVYALLARIYLNMGDYPNAEQYADLALSITSELLNFNGLSFTNNYTFPRYGDGNPEILLVTSLHSYWMVTTTTLNMDTALMALYDGNDLRPQAYFRQTANTAQRTFKGSYFGDNLFFTGLATDEVYLIAAEAKVRQGNLAEALLLLNTLRKHRHASDGFIDLEHGGLEQVLDWILLERRKELVLRGQRWSDLRRLNKESRYATTLKRTVMGQAHQLPPGDPRWVWPLPVEAVSIGGLVQNPRQ